MYKMGITTDCICNHRFTASKNMYGGKAGIIALYSIQINCFHVQLELLNIYLMNSPALADTIGSCCRAIRICSEKPQIKDSGMHIRSTIIIVRCKMIPTRLKFAKVKKPDLDHN